ncbi:hypothetical protein DFJ74DRAFT_678611 [Hyaloraphidium curvatum]|nr:hypothetical protein DFJ74DRAFT_678611 [Hyaloraphidium curvatum]
MEALSPVTFLILDGNMKKPLVISEETDAPLSPENLELVAPACESRGQELAAEHATKCFACRTRPYESARCALVLSSAPARVCVLAVCGEPACSERAERVLVSERRGLPPARDGKHPVMIVPRIAESWPEDAADPVFVDLAPPVEVEVPEALFRRGDSKDAIMTCLGREAQDLMKLIEPKAWAYPCINCGRESDQWQLLHALLPDHWPWQLLVEAFMSCVSCEHAVCKRVKHWSKARAARRDLPGPGIGVVCASCHLVAPEKNSFQRCSRCKMVEYCSKDCQRKDWSNHRRICRPAAQAAETE